MSRSTFLGALRLYLYVTGKFNEEIAKNNQRIQEIDQKLATIGAGGLPVVPAANQIATNTYDPGEAVALQNEQQQLRDKNRQIDALKTSKANELRQIGRRAGIPASYLRF